MQIPNDYSHLKKHLCTPNGHFDPLLLRGSVATISDVPALRCCLFRKGPRVVRSLPVLNMLPSLFFFFLSFLFYPHYVCNFGFWGEKIPFFHFTLVIFLVGPGRGMRRAKLPSCSKMRDP